MIRRLQQGMKEDGFEVPMTKLCRWFEVPRRTVYYRPIKSAPKVQARLAEPIKQLIEADPSFGYRTVAGLLQFNKNTVQRIFQIKGWQVRKRAVMADRPWRWSSTVTCANCSAGSSREAAGRRRQCRRSSRR